jgi:hypothetical protein
MMLSTAEQPAARLFQFALIAGKATKGQLELRRLRPGGMAQEFFEIGQMSEAADRAGQLGQLTEVYLSAVPRLRPAGTADACGAGWALWADLDSPAAVAALRTFIRDLRS